MQSLQWKRGPLGFCNDMISSNGDSSFGDIGLVIRVSSSSERLNDRDEERECRDVRPEALPALL